MEIEPGIVGTGEVLNLISLCLVVFRERTIAQSPRAYHYMVLGEDYAVQIINIGVLGLLMKYLPRIANATSRNIGQFDKRLSVATLDLQHGDHAHGTERGSCGIEQFRIFGTGGRTNLPITKNYLNASHCGIEEAVSEGTALAGGAGETPACGDAGKLHDDQWDEVIGERSIQESIHWDVGLHLDGFGSMINGEDIGKVSGTESIGRGETGIAGGIGAAVVYAEGSAGFVKAGDLGAERIDAIGVGGHCEEEGGGMEGQEGRMAGLEVNVRRSG